MASIDMRPRVLRCVRSGEDAPSADNPVEDYPDADIRKVLQHVPPGWVVVRIAALDEDHEQMDALAAQMAQLEEEGARAVASGAAHAEQIEAAREALQNAMDAAPYVVVDQLVLLSPREVSFLDEIADADPDDELDELTLDDEEVE